MYLFQNRGSEGKTTWPSLLKMFILHKQLGAKTAGTLQGEPPVLGTDAWSALSNRR